MIFSHDVRGLPTTEHENLRGFKSFALAQLVWNFSPRTKDLFLSRAAVRRHMAAPKECFSANLGFLAREIQVDVRISDVVTAAKALRDLRRMSNTSQTVLRVAQSTYTLDEPIISPRTLLWLRSGITICLVCMR